MPGATAPARVAVVGAGWAGLAAAVAATQRGAQVSLFDMAHTAGGRARTLMAHGQAFDNGQHILIGAYTATLALMRQVGAPVETLLWRGPLSLTTPDGQGLVLPSGPPLPAFVRGVLGQQTWPWRARWALLRAAAAWRLRGFNCPSDWTVDRLCVGLPRVVRDSLIEPLCVAALNTPMAQASATVFLRVLRDALFAGPGSADLLLPRAHLSALLPEPALAWLKSQGAAVHLGHRVQALLADGATWQLDGQTFDRVVLACPPAEAARLAESVAPDWAATARALRYEPIVTVWLRDNGLRLGHPMVALPAGPAAPAQFAFDLGALGQSPGLFTLVASAAADGLASGLPAISQAMLAQARGAFPGRFLAADALVHSAAERRATFACTPGLRRPAARIASGLVAAGDHVQGPYPATLEGAVRAGLAAAALL